MKKRLFGTDGLRGQVNIHPMTPEVALRLGLAAGAHFRNGKGRHRVVIGKDTRLSGYIFEYALASGFCASGMDVFLVGPLPTPAIAFLTRSMRADVGVVISASHNPYMDNGIKFFDRRGFKLPDEAEDRIADRVLAEEDSWEFPAPEDVGRAFKIEDSPGRYNVYLKSTIRSELKLDGLKVVMDCANGAAYRVSPLVFEELGAKVIKLGVDPDGMNINRKVGSLYPEVTARMVRETGADVGIALDGDADRVIMVDEKGAILDGDQIMAICAQDMMEKNHLPGNLLVATVMSNMALEVFMRERGGRLLRTAVGDRYVFEAMEREGAILGGEQSGHIIFRHHATTGDGTLAALQLIRIMLERGKPLSELAHQLEPYPQVLLNVHVERKIPFETVPAVADAVREAEAALQGKGRVLLRYSGTESVARVMVEGTDASQVQSLAESLAQTLKEHLR
ncbi:Phosphoglucosamine mutase [Fundidesulfovibrio magnetotacticus]|uniref:Phosphoglucosamine mutase n=1 Tax=Fundidesulfovibrio magnetotacticus TaxID=2730080 RepID=A0A6V8LZQ5_9BACT|nr:phosphoglucosamine mutase [Fundidesulfovibrio magnetotacticus]GFK95117.1 Phosphoglucosamine mutase [Fundidesulfovibrio magnetotacticus]